MADSDKWLHSIGRKKIETEIKNDRLSLILFLVDSLQMF